MTRFGGMSGRSRNGTDMCSTLAYMWLTCLHVILETRWYWHDTDITLCVEHLPTCDWQGTDMCSTLLPTWYVHVILDLEETGWHWHDTDMCSHVLLHVHCSLYTYPLWSTCIPYIINQTYTPLINNQHTNSVCYLWVINIPVNTDIHVLAVPAAK